MVCKSLPTNLVDTKSHGISQVMGYQEHGLQGFQLYIIINDNTEWLGNVPGDEVLLSSLSMHPQCRHPILSAVLRCS